MGNQGSKKLGKSCGKFEMENDEDILQRLRDADDKEIDSYDKLMAWLFEMAANEENCDTDKSTQIDEIKKACEHARERRAAWRQHSASCDSHNSAETSQMSRSGKSEDFVDIKSRLSVPICSRQTTFSDEDDAASSDGKYRLTVPVLSRQTTSSDEEEGAPYERKRRLFFPLSSRQTTFSDDDQTDGNELNPDNISEHTILVPSRENTKSLEPREALRRRRKNFRMSGKHPIFSASVGQLQDNSVRQLHDNNVPLNPSLSRKSASIAVMRHPTFDREQNIESQVSEDYEKVLDDKLLDRNIKDILLSVEVLFNDK
ncbi:uncharacterized protein LOC125651959 isoform X2 [Ostrea edulis]|uniref:uncharacterized protein LOC125651959 isoform X2 n=1 Tax=Ostrea edulis TaxID=37623 RepID=UPI0024AEFBE0|nr:uncharacterized protein LOC125651959 isoform X2 [Ostrea edulis]